MEKEVFFTTATVANDWMNEYSSQAMVYFSFAAFKSPGFTVCSPPISRSLHVGWAFLKANIVLKEVSVDRKLENAW